MRDFITSSLIHTVILSDLMYLDLLQIVTVSVNSCLQMFVVSEKQHLHPFAHYLWLLYLSTLSSMMILSIIEQECDEHVPFLLKFDSFLFSSSLLLMTLYIY